MEDKSKKCSHCKEIKKSEEFNYSKKTRDNLHGHCRACQKIVRRRWYLDNIEQQREITKQYSKTEKAKAEHKIHYHKYRESILLKNRIRRKSESALMKQRINERKRRLENPQYRISQTLRGRVRAALLAQNTNKAEKTLNLVGCTSEFLVKYLESKFTEGMSWDNYGLHGWHIDHIIPCDFFDLSIVEEQHKCFHYSNLQPLWAKENISKSNKLIYEKMIS